MTETAGGREEVMVVNGEELTAVGRDEVMMVNGEEVTADGREEVMVDEVMADGRGSDGG